MALTGRQKVAAFLLSLDTQTAASILSKFSEQEIDKLSREMLGMRSLEHGVIEEVHKEFSEMQALAQDFIPDTRAVTERLLASAMGEEKSRAVLSAQDAVPPCKPFEALAGVDARQIAEILRAEHPQIVALVLSHLTPQIAGTVLAKLPEELHSDVVLRMTRLEHASRQMLEQLDEIVTSKIQANAPKAGTVTEETGNKMVAEILNMVNKTIRKKALEEIGKEAPERVKQIENLMFVFDDFAGMDDKSIRKIVMEVDNDTLALALKTAGEDLKSKFMKNLSKRAAQMVQETLENLGPKPLSEVEAAQHEITRVAHALDEQGEIVMHRGEQEQLV